MENWQNRTLVKLAKTTVDNYSPGNVNISLQILIGYILSHKCTNFQWVGTIIAKVKDIYVA